MSVVRFACGKNCSPYDSSGRLGDLCVRKLRGGCTQVDRVNVNRTLYHTYGLKGCTATMTMITHKQCLRPDFICQVLYPSQSNLLPIQPTLRRTQLASVFVYDLLRVQPKPHSCAGPGSLPGTRKLTCFNRTFNHSADSTESPSCSSSCFLTFV